MKCKKLHCNRPATHRVKVKFDTSVRVRDLCRKHTEQWMHDAAGLPQTTEAFAQPLRD